MQGNIIPQKQLYVTMHEATLTFVITEIFIWNKNERL